MKEYESPATKYVKGTYTGSCYQTKNKKAATKKVSKKHNKVLDMLMLMMEVLYGNMVKSIKINFSKNRL